MSYLDMNNNYLDLARTQLYNNYYLPIWIYYDKNKKYINYQKVPDHFQNQLCQIGHAKIQTDLCSLKSKNLAK
jgi:hypothetical protein